MSLDRAPSTAVADAPGEDTRTVLSVGWLAKGVVYVVIGMLAIEIARRGYSSEDADQTGALSSIATVAAGRLLVFGLGVGLLFYAVWQLWAAVSSDAVDPLGVAKRIGWVGLAAVYGLLAHTALVIARDGGRRTGGDDNGPTSPTGLAVRLFDLPGGRAIVGAIGIGTVAVGGYNAWKGLSGDHLDDIETTGIGPLHRAVLRVLGVAGFAARSLLLGIAGWLLLDAARRYDPQRAAGIDESLHELARATFGTLLLVLTGLGLVAAGLYDMITFRRQRVADQA